MAIEITITADSLSTSPNTDGIDIAASEESYEEMLENAMRESYGDVTVNVRYTNTYGHMPRPEVSGAEDETQEEEIAESFMAAWERIWERGEFWVAA
jgi:hypothetical protein